jgi:hypothetical protein
MKCPSCKYIHGFDIEKNEDIEGEKGQFFDMPVKMERSHNWNDEARRLFACPACGIAFINV